MKAELQEMVRDAWKELREASGVSLIQEEENQHLRKAAIQHGTSK